MESNPATNPASHCCMPNSKEHRPACGSKSPGDLSAPPGSAPKYRNGTSNSTFTRSPPHHKRTDAQLPKPAGAARAIGPVRVGSTFAKAERWSSEAFRRLYRSVLTQSPGGNHVPAVAIGTPIPGSTCTGPLADGRTSMSNISVGMYTVEHEFGMSTTPDSLPSIGAEPRIMYA